MKVVKAVAPYHHPGFLNFKTVPYEEWKKCGGQIAKPHYPWRVFHRLAFNCYLPSLRKDRHEARLRFVQGSTILFDSFPDYCRYEVIPFIWDCWPSSFQTVETFFIRNQVKTAIFTSSQAAKIMKERFPSMNILAITEGIDESGYFSGGPIKYRKNDILEYGREIDNVVKYNLPDTVRYIHGKVNGRNVFTSQQLFESLAHTKIVLAFPKSMTDPEESGGIETLTQRYWEGMLSGALLVGHAPKELVDLFGYNPVIEAKLDNCNAQMMEILEHIGGYQPLVDKNKEMALKYGKWNHSIQLVVEFLQNNKYKV